MSFDDYFRDELSFLREQGSVYSELRPHLANYLHAKNSDPDVERLLEGFAFLTGKLREKIDDDFPELTHSIINMLWPNFLRPFPSATIVQFTPIQDVLSTQKIVSHHIKLSSKTLDNGIKCLFRTCRPIKVYPLERIGLNVNHSRETSTIRIDFKAHGNVALEQLNLDELSFFLGEQSYESQHLYLWFHHFLKSIQVTIGEDVYDIPTKNLESAGWMSDDGILPYPKNVYEGYRLLHEYLAYPEAFLFISVKNIHQHLQGRLEQDFSLVFKFTRPLPSDIRINHDHLRIHCVPAVNLFEHDADPIDLSGLKTEYRICPSNQLPEAYEVFSIDRVVGWDKSLQGRFRGDGRVYTAFESFQHEIERVNNRLALYYRVRTKESYGSDGFDYFVSFVRADELAQVGLNETISIELTCTNRDLPLELGKGDIDCCFLNEPEYVTVTNITEPTMPLRPILDGTLLWTLISNLSLNYLSLLSKDALRTIIKAYDFRALIDRQAEKISRLRIEDGIVSIETKPVDRIFKGMPIRGVESILVLDNEAFANEGDLYLFAKVLSKFFSLYASINSFHDLLVINHSTNEHYRFQTQIGRQPLI